MRRATRWARFRSVRRGSRRPAAVVLFSALATGLAASALAAAGQTTVAVPATAGWVPTGVTVSESEQIRMKAEGTAMTINPSALPALFRASPSEWEGRSGPAGQPFTCQTIIDASGTHTCLLDGAPYGALVGRVGETAFLIGDASTLSGPAGASGELYLGVNDNVSYHSDNMGAFSVHLGS